MGEKLLGDSLGTPRYLLVIPSRLGRSSGLYGALYGFFVCIIVFGVSWSFPSWCWSNGKGRDVISMDGLHD